MGSHKIRPGRFLFVGIAVFVLTVVTAAPLAAAGDDSKDLGYSEEFALGDSGRLTIDVDDMDVRVKTDAGGVSRVDVFFSGRDRDNAREWLDESHFEAHVQDNQLTIRCRDPKSRMWGFDKRFNSMRVLAVVTVPRRTTIDIRTEDGDVRIDDIDGDAHVHTEDGDLELAGVRGTTIEIESEDGDIKAGSLTADEITVVTEDGDVDIESLTGSRVSVSSSDGDISVSKIEGDHTSIDTSDGDIEFAVSGTRLKTRCSDGDLTARLLTGMEVDIQTGDGDIDLYIPKGTGADVDLRGGHVSIRDIAVKGTVTDETIKGSINNGGPPIRIRAHDGSIRIREG